MKLVGCVHVPSSWNKTTSNSVYELAVRESITATLVSSVVSEDRRIFKMFKDGDSLTDVDREDRHVLGIHLARKSVPKLHS